MEPTDVGGQNDVWELVKGRGGRQGLLRMDIGVLTIASVATKAGPALVAPVAETKGWRHLVLPGIIVAMLGYAVGNYVGFSVAQAVRAALGG